MLARCSLLLLLAAGCSDEESGVLVTLKTDLVPYEEWQTATTELFDTVPRDAETSRRFAQHAANADQDYARGIRIAELDARPGRRVVRVTLRDYEGAWVARRIVLVEVRRRTSSVVVITRDCREVSCPDGFTCEGGDCIDPSCSPDNPAACGPPECTADSMCMPPAACAVGMCTGEGSCLAAPGACPPGQWCNPDVGCESMSVFPDAGPPDTGPPPGVDAGDLFGPTIYLDPIPDPAPLDYDAMVTITFTFRCDDGEGKGCDPAAVSCLVDLGMPGVLEPVSCTMNADGTGSGMATLRRFGNHQIQVGTTDLGGRGGATSVMFTVTRCARDLQFPYRTSNGFTRGACCSGLTDAVHRDGDLYSARSDGSCRDPSDHVANVFERTYDGIGCAAGLVEAAAGGCAGPSARRVCLESTATAAYCGTDDPMGRAFTPMHTRLDEGWHVGRPCEPGFTSSSSTMMRRAGAEDVCWGTVDQAHDRWSLSSSESCDAVTTRYCRSDPPIPGLECVCSSGPDPYADDGRG